MVECSKTAILVLLSIVWVSQAAVASLPPVLNEVMASNSKTLADSQGQFDDWVEIFNPGTTAINLAGMYLTDDPTKPNLWKFPTNSPQTTTIAAGGYLLVWCDGDVTSSGLHASFKLNSTADRVLLYGADGATLIDSVAFTNQRCDVAYGRSPNGTGEWCYLSTATPGTVNNRPAYLGVVAEPTYSRNRGFYDTPMDVILTCDTPGATIYYTIDGRDPYDWALHTPTGSIYAGPIHITKTTCLRACAAENDWLASKTVTCTYIFLSDVITRSQASVVAEGYPSTWFGTYPADYEMDPEVVNDPNYAAFMKDAMRAIPALSIVSNRDNFFSKTNDPVKGGIYIYTGHSSTGGADWERPVSAELFTADGSRDLQVDCGIRIQGGEGRNPQKCPKHCFSLRFRSEYGATELHYPLFADSPVTTFNSVELRAFFNNTWHHWDPGQRQRSDYVRDQWAHDALVDMGQTDAGHGLYVHLYIDGVYWGLYLIQERPSADTYAAYHDADPSRIDTIKGGRAVDGNTVAWNEAKTIVAGKDWNRIVQVLDIDSFIDWSMMNLFTGNQDLKTDNNWCAAGGGPDRRPWRFYAWDAEHVLESTQQTSTSPSSDPTGMLTPLMQIEEFRIRFGDRIQKHMFNGGALTADRNAARWLRRGNEIDLAVISESARWGDYRRDVAQYQTGPYYLYTKNQFWIPEKTRLLTDYFPKRNAIALQQFKSMSLYPNVDAPVFYINGVSQFGGHASTNAALSMQATTGTIWYTLDGSDPRVPGSGGTGGSSSTVTLVAENAAKKVLVPTAAVNNAWRGGADFNDSAWISGTGGVGYERSTGYESYFSINVNAQMYNKNGSCFIRVPFTVASADIGKVSSLTLNMRCDDGFIAYINGVEVARKNFTGTPAWNSLAGAATNDVDAVELQAFDLSAYVGALVAGTNILAIQGLNETLTSSDFLISETLTAVRGSSATTPAGVSPTAIKYTSAVTLTASTHIKARILSGSTWSALNEAIYAVGPVASGLRISEIMYHPLNSGNPNDPNTEFVELTNVGSAQINLNFVQFTKGVTFTFGNLDLAPKAYTLVVKDLAAFKAKYGNTLPIAGQYDGSLSNAGERIQLVDAAGQVIEDFTYADGWYKMTDGQGFSLTAANAAVVDPNGFNDASFWRPSAHIGGSPGYDDTGLVPALGAVVINEIMANPKSGESDWIELYNSTNQPINIGEWFLSDDGDNLMKYQVAAGTSIPAKGYIVFTAGLNFGNGADPGCRVPFGFSKDGETAYLTSGSGGVLTGYTQQEHFDATETGVSIGRYNKSAGGYNFVELTSPTPGAVNAAPKVGPIVISEIMYNPAATPDSEYVELLNISDSPVPLYDPITRLPWRLTAGDPNNPTMEFLFPTDSPITLEPGQRMILTKDSEGFNWQFGAAPTDVPILAWGLGWLSNDGDKVQISKPVDVTHWIRVDRVVYSDGSHPDFGVSADPWPKAADGQGQSLVRIDPTAYGNDPANWRAATPTPGR